MGAWGAGSFENDDALDWLAALRAGGGDGALVHDTLEAIAGAPREDYVEAPDAACALAAAEMVAAAAGAPAGDLPAEAGAWAEAHGAALAPAASDLAVRAVERVATESELRELWDEADPEPWNASLDDLRSRLREG